MGRRFIPKLIEEHGEYSEELSRYMLPGGSGLVLVKNTLGEWISWPYDWPRSDRQYQEYLSKGTCDGYEIRVINFVPD